MVSVAKKNGGITMSTQLTITIPVWLDFIFTLPLLTYRLLRFGYTFRKIPLGDGLFTLVEPRDFYTFNKSHWFPRVRGSCIYAARFIYKPDGKLKMLSLHREIINAPAGLLVDHRNNDGLDNRKANLRFATHAENSRNKRKTRSKTSSRFVGVFLVKRSGRWKAAIQSNGKTINLGTFDSEIDAAKAYDEAARKYHKDFARLNFPEEN